ncbi:hypothetical protein [Actinoplanes sp. N902-109]|uniref:hypothetical protein n=1 Tax=Actinoplanes sp. (strain N902-109) TaxID=649831 RepID=UPI00032947BB|nr:hypothetical protein [Actinoplanes sp. N902-109]AGL13784.1 hypothetical protein L083_0274 [Actinoplanes sp. N902-109]
MRRPLITLLAASALAGCSATQAPAAAPNPQTSSAPVVSPAPASPVPKAAAGPVPGATASPAAKTVVKNKKSPCPVTAKQLKAASPHAPAPFEKIECHEDIAMAVVPQSKDPNGYDAAVYVFTHDAGGWREIAQGSSLNCYDYMPGNMAAHFSYCN